MLRVAEIYQGVEPGHHLEDDVAALAAVAAVRSAIFDELLAAKADRARAAGARAEEDFRLIKKMHGAALGRESLNRNEPKIGRPTGILLST